MGSKSRSVSFAAVPFLPAKSFFASLNCAVEVLPQGSGKMRMSTITSASGNDLMSFISEFIEPGTTLKTDAWRGYRPVATSGYKHKITNVTGTGNPAHIKMPLVHQAASTFDRWWLGTYHGAIGKDQLNAYLAEYCFRHNRRNTQQPGELFEKLVTCSIQSEAAPYSQIIKSKL